MEENDHPIEQVRLTVDPTDNPTLPMLTWRAWVLGVSSCALLSFTNTFFGYRTNPISVGSVCVQIITLPIGRLLASALPNRLIRIPFTSWCFSLNPGPFSMKEHCLITIFAGVGSGGAAIAIITIVKAFYHRQINPIAAMLLVLTTQMFGYGWAGVFRKYLVDSPYMWWPAKLVQVSLFKALHLKEKREKRRLTTFQFFTIVFIGSFAYYAFPGFLFPSISSISILCLIYKESITMQQIGSGLSGLGIGSFGLDWSTVVGFLGSPLATPTTAIFNIMISYVFIVYALLPLGYWTNTYSAKRFPLISADVFASLTATVTHVALYHGKDIYKMLKKSKEYAADKREDVHTRLMKRNYERVPQWWFLVLLVLVFGLSIFTCMGFDRKLQLPWWGVLLSCGLALFFTLPVGVIVATTNMGPGLNVLSEYIMGVMLPGKPLANVTFKTYSILTMGHALSLLSDLNLGHYMKIPPKSMFITQCTGTIIGSLVSFGTAWLLLDSVVNICDPSKLPPESPWTCPGDNVFYNASIIWGLVGPKRMFGKLGHYSALNYFFLIGFLLPIPFWLLAVAFPQKKWLRHIHIPLLIAGGSSVPPVHSVNYIMWGAVGIFFNYYVYKRYKNWWARHTYVMSAALDAGVAFMAILIYFALQSNNIYGIDWWGGAASDHCPLVNCPTAPGVIVQGCPIN